MAYPFEARKLIEQIQALETEAHRIGLHTTGHALNNAKNAGGWEFAGNVEEAARASKGIRPGEARNKAQEK
jgi:hypothetical protein